MEIAFATLFLNRIEIFARLEPRQEGFTNKIRGDMLHWKKDKSRVDRRFEERALAAFLFAISQNGS